ncbi:MAG: DUF3368 domain-containing protein [Candidatus Bipolaricaulia bacterium]
MDTTNIKRRERLKELPESLGEGEREAIILAQELKTALLTEDAAASREAKRRRIPLVSSLTELEKANNMKLIPAAKEILDELIESGFRISEDLYRGFLKRMQENGAS